MGNLTQEILKNDERCFSVCQPEGKMLRNDENYIQNRLMHYRRFALIDASMVGRYFPDDERMCAVPS